MQNILVGICENSDADTKLLVQYLEMAEVELKIKIKIHTYSNGIEFAKANLSSFDILFINISLPDTNVKELLAVTRQKNDYAYLILTSENQECISIGYEYDARNHFVKPLWYFKILNEIKKYISCVHMLDRPYVWINDRNHTYKLYLHKLRYIETSNRQLLIHYSDRIIAYHGNLSEFEQRLSENDFFRCNNSYLVNLKYIDRIEADINRYMIRLVTDEEIPLSRSKKKELLKIMEL